MALQLDEIDRRLLTELQADADRPNVELARIVGLSPAATLNRVRRLKEEGVITGIRAGVDAKALGYPLHVFVAVTLSEHDERAHRRFEAAARKVPQLVRASWVTGETDVLCEVVARDVDELQRILLRLSAGGAQRILTLLRLEELRPPGPVPAP
jgi:Lrp/AsnC family leucine-responsive transcriptional regulator